MRRMIAASVARRIALKKMGVGAPREKSREECKNAGTVPGVDVLITRLPARRRSIS
ncbi:hypothetical protein [Janthinobacterium sp. HLX7-2]|uniref:hypothetical protein n=1 Tax=Janthinobacterium sp. HLX7-2 TaxID=1259331 RepID=UPI003F1E613E